MRHDGFDPAHFKGQGILALLMLITFATELAVTELLTPLFSHMDLVSSGLLDAALVVAIVAAPMCFFFFRLLPMEESNPGDSRAHRATLLIKALTWVFLVEYLAMLLLPNLLPLASSHSRALVDAFLVAASCRLVLRPKLLRHAVLRMDTPLRLYVLLLCTVFLSGLVQEFVLPFRVISEFFAPGEIVEALLTTLCGAPLLWFLVVQPLKRAARSEQTRVAAVHAQVIDAIVAIDQQGVVRTFNPAAERIFGYDAEQIIDSQAALLFDQGEQGLQELLSSAAACAGHPALPVVSELSCRRRDGLTLIMSVSISEVLLERQKPEFLLIMRDITSRKAMEEALRESEMRFREIFHQSEDGIIFCKRGGSVVLDANANAEKIFGYSKGELQSGGLQQVGEPADPPLLCQVIGAIEEGKLAQHDFLCRRKDQTLIVVSMRGKVMYLQGVPVTYCSFRDITDRIRMEERTRDIQAKLIQTNKMTSLGLLVSGVAHEINNPNNFIMANCELLTRISKDSLAVLKEYSEERQEGEDFLVAGIPFSELEHHSERLLDGIAEGSRRVDDIVNKLKAFARQERNQVKREVDVNQVARSAVSLLRHELIKFTNNFQLELPKDLPPVKAHGQQLGQVIINLLMNACQALPGKEHGIQLSTSFDAQEGMVVIAVRDEGCGMSREDSQRIMEPFFTTRLDNGGTGLGLSISDSIVKEHGGVLEFSSEPGRGTTFSVRLPAANAFPPLKGEAPERDGSVPAPDGSHSHSTFPPEGEGAGQPERRST